MNRPCKSTTVNHKPSTLDNIANLRIPHTSLKWAIFDVLEHNWLRPTPVSNYPKSFPYDDSACSLRIQLADASD